MKHSTMRAAAVVFVLLTSLVALTARDAGAWGGGAWRTSEAPGVDASGNVYPAALTVPGTGPNAGIGTPLLLSGQAPGATNGSAGLVRIGGASPTGTGTYGGLQIYEGGTTEILAGPYGMASGGGTTYGAIWFATTSPTQTNFGFLGNQSFTYVNVPTGGTVSLSINGAANTGVDVSASTVRISPATVDLHGVTTTTSAPSAGGAGALPATPAGYFTLSVGGVAHKVAFY